MTFDRSRAQYGAQKNPGNYISVAMKDRPGMEGHHSVGVYGAVTADQFFRAVNRDHLGRGWLDTFYNRLFWADGTIGEGRPDHATSGSVRSLTGCLAGNFETRHMTLEMKQSVARVRNDAMGRGLPSRISKHKDRSAVACPGRNSLPFWDTELAGMSDSAPLELMLGDRVLRLTDPFMRGPDVLAWQLWLNDFLVEHRQKLIGPDSIFGPATAEASAFFMAERMGVSTHDPRVGPRTIELMEVWREKKTAGKGRDEPDFIVAGIASNDIDEGMARVACKRFGWRYLRYPEQALDYRLGTAVAFGAVGSRITVASWDDIVLVRGANRDETATLVERYMKKSGDSRSAPAA